MTVKTARSFAREDYAYGALLLSNREEKTAVLQSSPGQTITTFQRKISTHCWGGATCCAHLATLLRCVAICRTNLTKPVTSCNDYKCFVKNLTIFELEPTAPKCHNTSQQDSQTRSICCAKNVVICFSNMNEIH